MPSDGVITEIDVAMPMRDGMVLRSDLMRPDGPGPFPALLNRTPYKKSVDDLEAFARAGYAVLSQDLRGRYASDGEFVVFSEECTLDAEDGYDSVEWIARQPWCTGRVGTFGASYNAWAQYQLARLQPPHLVAMSAASIPTELTDVDWPGAFKPARRLKWWFTNMAPDLRRRAGLPPPHTKEEAVAEWEAKIGEDFIHRLPYVELCDLLPPPLRTQARKWMENPGIRPWRLEDAHRKITVPNLDFTGWFDHCCSIGNFLGLRENAATEIARNQTRMVIGPWNHGGFGRRVLGDFDFGSEAAVDVQQIQIRWFDYWLKREANRLQEEPAVRYFVMGSGRWRSATTWPPPESRLRTLFLDSLEMAPGPGTSGRLSEDGPDTESCVTFTSDPNAPVPTLWDSSWFSRVADRRELNHRTDILRFRSEPLNCELEIAGNPGATILLSSDAPDTDLFARLADEYPDGTAMEICYGMVRARHRDGTDKEALLKTGERVGITIPMGITACRFAVGHRIRLEITSSDFPNHDRNHQTGRNDLFDPELRVARNTVWQSVNCPSRLELPVMTGD
ncbi:MAG: CocE/NonD family hydrolase [Opitutaceae bacterium]